MLWLNNIDYWHWWMLAGALLILELSRPKFFYMLVGIVAAAVGFLVFAFPEIPFVTQFLAFSVFSVVAAIAWWHYRDT